MSQMNRSSFAPSAAPAAAAPAGATGTGGPGPRPRPTKVSGLGIAYVDWKDVDTLRRMMSPNGKILSRRRLGASAREQRMIGQAIKRARYMALLPYTSATL